MVKNKIDTQSGRREKGSSLLRLLGILEAVAESDRPMSPTDLAFHLDIPKATAHRLVQMLEVEGFLQTNLRGNLVPAERFHSISLGVLYTSRFKVERQAILMRLSKQIGETCGIAIPDGAEMKYFDRVQSNWPLQVHLPIGARVPVACTSSGKLYLSSLPDNRLERIVRNLPLQQMARNTVMDNQKLLADIQHIRKSGIGIDNEEFIDGMVACAVPISTPDGRFVASLFCHTPIIRKRLKDLLQYTDLMQQAAAELTPILGPVENKTT